MIDGKVARVTAEEIIKRREAEGKARDRSKSKFHTSRLIFSGSPVFPQK